MMAGYKEIDPDLPNRIMTMAEQSAAANRAMHVLITRGAVRERLIGQLISGAIAIATIVRDGITGSTGLTTLVIVVLTVVFVFSRLPDWWHSWRRPSNEKPSEAGPDDSGDE